MCKDKKWQQQSKITFVMEQRDWQQLMESFLKILVWLKTQSTFFNILSARHFIFYRSFHIFCLPCVAFIYLCLFLCLSLFCFLPLKFSPLLHFLLFLIFDSFFLTFLQFLFKALSLSLVLLYLYLPLFLTFSFSRFLAFPSHLSPFLFHFFSTERFLSHLQGRTNLRFCQFWKKMKEDLEKYNLGFLSERSNIFWNTIF